MNWSVATRTGGTPSLRSAVSSLGNGVVAGQHEHRREGQAVLDQDAGGDDRQAVPGPRRVGRGDHGGQEADEDEEAQPSPGQLPGRDAGQADREGEQEPLDAETAPGTRRRGDHDDDERHDRDELEPGIEPVDRPGPAR